MSCMLIFAVFIFSSCSVPEKTYENGVLYTVSGFENLQYGLTKVQISDDYDKYVVDGENRYLCLTVDTLNKLTGIG